LQTKLLKHFAGRKFTDIPSEDFTNFFADKESLLLENIGLKYIESGNRKSIQAVLATIDELAEASVVAAKGRHMALMSLKENPNHLLHRNGLRTYDFDKNQKWPYVVMHYDPKSESFDYYAVPENVYNELSLLLTYEGKEITNKDGLTITLKIIHQEKSFLLVGSGLSWENPIADAGSGFRKDPLLTKKEIEKFIKDFESSSSYNPGADIKIYDK
jgi:hypothetical protein